MPTWRHKLIGLLLAVVATTASAQLQKKILNVTVDGGSFQRAAAIQVHVSVAGKALKGTPQTLPKGSTNVRAWYDACTSVDEKSDPGPSALSVFCDLKDQQTRLVHTAEEPADELLAGRAHAFNDRLTLPQDPVGTKLWIIAGANYDTPNSSDPHVQVVGWTFLIYRCDKPKSKQALVKCAYYTPGGWAIKQHGSQLPPKTIHP